MKPDDELLALWVEDELAGPDRARVEAWAAAEPEWLELREQARSSRRLLGSVLSAREEVPHGEFFEARLRREIRRQAPAAETSRPAAVAPAAKFAWSWLAPLTAAAGIAIGFWAGRGGSDEEAAPLADTAPVLYTPDQRVRAEWVESDGASVIVLAGVEALPDGWDIPETVHSEPETGHRAVQHER